MSKLNKLGLIFFPAFDWSISPTHPEREERLLYTKDQIEEEGLTDIENIKFYNPSVATLKDVRRVHFITNDNIVTNSHLISSGASIKALELVVTKEVDKSFSLVRPPGHHAMRVVYGDRGFCVLNNEAIMIEAIRAKYGNLKIAIIDTDCHHGDGTEEIYYNDHNTLFISVHQDGRTLYPGTGYIDELGGPSAYGYNINIPLPPNTTDEGYMYVTNNVINPILKEFKPDLIINSAGQDNHYSDPLTNMNLSAKGYAKLNELIDFDCAVLEGGYSVTGALPYINLGIILSMAGLDYSNIVEPDYNDNKIKQDKDITNYIEKISKEIMFRWNNKKYLRDELFRNKKTHKVNKRIYYDTSNITEHQEITYNICNKCTGIETIDSISDKGDHIFAIVIPRNACNKCLNQGKELYLNSKSNYTKVFLQNKKEDEYLSI